MSDFPAREAAMFAYLEASARVAEMIASAINVDPEWFWKNMRRR
jgi:hypothetical protein